MLEKTVYSVPDLKFSLRGLFTWENDAKVGSVWIYIVLTSVEWISACQHPESFLDVNPNQSVPGAGLNCLQPPSDVPGRSRCCGLLTVSCLLVPVCRNKNNFNGGFCDKVAAGHTGALMQSLWALSGRVGCQVNPEEAPASSVVAIEAFGRVLS